MDYLRHSRTIGRVLAAWLLLWFCAMAAPLPSRSALAGAIAAVPDCTAGQLAPAPLHPDAQARLHPVHGEHASDSWQHCPLCTHAAAPPLPQFALALVSAEPDHIAAAHAASPARVRTDTPPPARAPPRLS